MNILLLAFLTYASIYMWFVVAEYKITNKQKKSKENFFIPINAWMIINKLSSSSSFFIRYFFFFFKKRKEKVKLHPIKFFLSFFLQSKIIIYHGLCPYINSETNKKAAAATSITNFFYEFIRLYISILFFLLLSFLLLLLLLFWHFIKLVMIIINAS